MSHNQLQETWPDSKLGLWWTLQFCFEFSDGQTTEESAIRFQTLPMNLLCDDLNHYFTSVHQTYFKSGLFSALCVFNVPAIFSFWLIDKWSGGLLLVQVQWSVICDGGNCTEYFVELYSTRWKFTLTGLLMDVHTVLRHQSMCWWHQWFCTFSHYTHLLHKVKHWRNPLISLY